MIQRPWLESYPDGVPAEIEADSYPSLNDFLAASWRRFGTDTAFTNHGTSMSFDELDRASRAFAAFLQSGLELGRGERVAVMIPNLLQSPVVVCGILRAGLVVVNVNPLYTRRELEHVLADSGARAIVVLENFAHTVADVFDATPLEAVVVTRAGDHFPWLKRLAANWLARRKKPGVPPYRISASVEYRDAIEQGKTLPYREPHCRGSDIAFLQYTGGTTGRPKGAMLTHRNMVGNVLQAMAWVDPFYDARTGIVVVTALPLYHIFALTVNLLAFIGLGAHNLLITDPRDMRGFVRELSKRRFGFITGVNTLFNALLQTPGFARLDFSDLTICLGGGMAVQRAVAERWQAVTGVVIAQGYGLTETSPIVAANRLDVKAFNGSVGLPLPSTDVAIIGDAGDWLEIGESGEICVAGPQVMAGYWRQPEATAATFAAEGWLRTGDLGRLDEQGLLYIEDRKKDVIIVSGFNVTPNEVEDVAALHPGVLEAAAIGVPDEQTGEAVKLFVVRKDAALDAEAILAHCRENLTGYKIPSHVVFIDELPKSNVGKVLRRELRPRSEGETEGRSEGETRLEAG